VLPGPGDLHQLETIFKSKDWITAGHAQSQTS
jgi:hypothetical protein